MRCLNRAAQACGQADPQARQQCEATARQLLETINRMLLNCELPHSSPNPFRPDLRTPHAMVLYVWRRAGLPPKLRLLETGSYAMDAGSLSPGELEALQTAAEAEQISVVQGQTVLFVSLL